MNIKSHALYSVIVVIVFNDGFFEDSSIEKRSLKNLNNERVSLPLYRTRYLECKCQHHLECSLYYLVVLGADVVVEVGIIL